MIPAELWAWAGLDRDTHRPSVAEQATDPTVLEFDKTLVEALVRAAYSAGYTHALTDPDTLTYAEAILRRDQLHLMLPVA